MATPGSKSTELTTFTDQLVTRGAWTREAIDLVKRTCAADSTDAELAMFLHICKTAGLDPLQGQAHFIKTRDGKVGVKAGVDGMQARAEEFEDYEGTQVFDICDKDDFAFDALKGEPVKHVMPLQRGNIVGAWARVVRKGMMPFVSIVRMSEYSRPGREGRKSNWDIMPGVMIKKVARDTALRMAFPKPFSGVYGSAEIAEEGVPQTFDEMKSVFEQERKHWATAEEWGEIAEKALGADEVRKITNWTQMSVRDMSMVVQESRRRRQKATEPVVEVPQASQILEAKAEPAKPEPDPEPEAEPQGRKEKVFLSAAQIGAIEAERTRIGEDQFRSWWGRLYGMRHIGDLSDKEASEFVETLKTVQTIKHCATCKAVVEAGYAKMFEEKGMTVTCPTCTRKEAEANGQGALALEGSGE